VLFAGIATVILATFGIVNAGLAGFAMLWSFNFTISLQFNVMFSTEAEAKFNSVERMLEYSQSLQSERDNKRTYHDHLQSTTTTASNSSTGGGLSWPIRGDVEFKNVVMRYAPTLPPALKGVSFSVKHGTTVGIVGRTGAGKSSLASALFRLVQPLDSGAVLIDGVDVMSLGLDAIRGASRGVAIIPQNPCLFSGTVRSNLDPFHRDSDEAIINALQSVRLGSLQLDDEVQEAGQNFSVGEAQLLCLARAKLRNPFVLVLDEATASLDTETDEFIQGAVEDAFSGTTKLVIAHRLRSIVKADMVCVMDDGRVAEYATPEKLLRDDGSLFSSLVNSTGSANAAELRSIVFRTAEKMVRGETTNVQGATENVKESI
jgi:ABC-type multidrug transport system fused ATPase/permease subunit